jgi:uncharacterized protein (DUF983 family)
MIEQTSTFPAAQSPAPAAAATPALARRDWQQAVGRGARCRCPACGEGKLYTSYLKVADSCPACHEELHHQRADDAPPYFTMLITGHIIVAGVMTVEEAFQPALWVHMALWAPLLLGLSLVLLPVIKGALVGLQWALRMHGFGGQKAGESEKVEPLVSGS